jgi:hypothetical protein
MVRKTTSVTPVKQIVLLVGVPMVVIVGGTLLVYFLMAGASSTKHDPAAAPQPTASSSSTITSYSDRCRLALLTWARAAEDVSSSLALGAPATDAVSRTATSYDQLSVYCNDSGLAATIANTNYQLALANARLGTGQPVSAAQVRSFESRVSMVRGLAR